MSTKWWSIEDAITFEDIERVNDLLSVGRAFQTNIQPITLRKNLIDETVWLERTDEHGQHHALEVLDYDDESHEFSEMKRWGMNGGNGTGEAILRPLVELGEITIVSEYNDQHYQNTVRLEEQALKDHNKNMRDETLLKFKKPDHNKLGASTKEERMKAGLTKH